MLLRIEDTDAERSQPELIEAILRGPGVARHRLGR